MKILLVKSIAVNLEEKKSRGFRNFSSRLYTRLEEVCSSARYPRQLKYFLEISFPRGENRSGKSRGPKKR